MTSPHGPGDDDAGDDDAGDDDRFHEECGVFGIFDYADAAAVTALGLHALQHRGQASAGIVSFDGERFQSHRALGLVGDIFSDAKTIAQLPGSAAIGHNRYATAGEIAARNIQPLYADFAFGGLALANNGNLTNALNLRRTLVDAGSLFQSTTDTEVFQHLIAHAPGVRLVDKITAALREIEGAYSLVALSEDALVGARDPLGVRPLVLGELGDSWVLASETCAFDIMGATFVREIEPGEIVIIDSTGVHSQRHCAPATPRPCIFELIYFARPDSVMAGANVYQSRKSIGAELAHEAQVPADIVVPVPDSGVPAAIGYAAAAGLPFELGLIRNHYVGRTFIEPTDEIRHLGVKLKHNANAGELHGKRVILVDDSIVRGTTSRKIVEMVRRAGAKEVHVRISSPPTTHSCFYGIATPSRDELLASKYDVNAIRQFIGADSLAFISIDGLYRALGNADRNQAKPQFCDACFSGEYPTQLTDHNDGEPKRALSLLSSITA